MTSIAARLSLLSVLLAAPLALAAGGPVQRINTVEPGSNLRLRKLYAAPIDAPAGRRGVAFTLANMKKYTTTTQTGSLSAHEAQMVFGARFDVGVTISRSGADRARDAARVAAAGRALARRGFTEELSSYGLDSRGRSEVFVGKDAKGAYGAARISLATHRELPKLNRQFKDQAAY